MKEPFIKTDCWHHLFLNYLQLRLILVRRTGELTRVRLVSGGADDGRRCGGAFEQNSSGYIHDKFCQSESGPSRKTAAESGEALRFLWMKPVWTPSGGLSLFSYPALKLESTWKSWPDLGKDSWSQGQTQNEMITTKDAKTTFKNCIFNQTQKASLHKLWFSVSCENSFLPKKKMVWSLIH